MDARKELKSAAAKLQSKMKPRPIAEFADFSRFKLPEGGQKAFDRLRYNFPYFCGNYIIIFALFVILSLVWQPLILVPIVFLVGFIAFELSGFAQQYVGDYLVEERRMIAYAILFLVLLFWLGGAILIVNVLLSLLLVLAHALMRIRSVKNKVVGTLDEVTDNLYNK
eukprot:TRINITY_DN3554_c0_g1_i1.p1 TRINITY_DN3554_c0_g1~~TRINITY_DN3554_c0_g1_i1.p1  ORF type:complete len:167 (-),score=24.43 TRINITY_DN3554_c0_g1_i1:98-598(-)